MKVLVLAGLVAVVLAAAVPAAAGVREYVAANDTTLALCESGHYGVQRLEFLADDTGYVLLHALGASHAIVASTGVFLRANVPRTVNAIDFNWSSIDSADVVLTLASELIVTEKD